MTLLHLDNEKMDAALRQAFNVREEEPQTLQPKLAAELSRSRVAAVRRQSRRRFMRRGLALAGALGSLTFVAVALPKILVWRALAQMVESAENVRSMHSIQWSIEENRGRRKIREMWFQNGLWRIESPRGVQIHSAGKSYFYEPRARLATWRPDTNGPFTHKSSGFSVRAIIADMARWGWRDKVTLSPKEQVLEGRRARVATIEPVREKIRIVLYAAPDTLLPFRYDLLRPTRGGWKLSQTSTIEYNLPLPAVLFQPKFAPGTRIVRQGEGREKWERSLRKAKAVLSVGQQRIVVREVTMNERGDLFVLFTAGRERDVDSGAGVMTDVETPNLKLSGAEGEFLPVSMLHSRPSQGFYSETDGPGAKKRMEGVHVDGEPLQWAVWTRLEPLTPAQAAREQRVSLMVNSVAFARNSNGAFDRRVEIPQSAPATLTLRGATVGLVPDYVRHFVIPMSEADLLSATDETRASALRYGVRHGEKPQPEELQKSLVLYRAVIERTEEQWQERGNTGVQPGKWLAVAELCYKLNRLDEAHEALSRAEEDNRIYGNAGDSTTRGIEDLKQILARP